MSVRFGVLSWQFFRKQRAQIFSRSVSGSFVLLGFRASFEGTGNSLCENIFNFRISFQLSPSPVTLNDSGKGERSGEERICFRSSFCAVPPFNLTHQRSAVGSENSFQSSHNHKHRSSSAKFWEAIERFLFCSSVLVLVTLLSEGGAQKANGKQLLRHFFSDRVQRTRLFCCLRSWGSLVSTRQLQALKPQGNLLEATQKKLRQLVVEKTPKVLCVTTKTAPSGSKNSEGTSRDSGHIGDNLELNKTAFGGRNQNTKDWSSEEGNSSLFGIPTGGRIINSLDTKRRVCSRTTTSRKRPPLETCPELENHF